MYLHKMQLVFIRTYKRSASLYLYFLKSKKNGLVSLEFNMLLRMSAAGSSLIAPPMSVRQRPRRTQLLKRHVGKQNLPLSLRVARHTEKVLS